MKRTKKNPIVWISLAVAAVMSLCPSLASSQTLRGDFDYNGHTDVNDLTELINYLLTEEWDAAPSNVVRDTLTVKGVQFVMVHVDGGSYSMGEGITATVQDFCIGQTEVTQRLWRAVMGNNPSSYGAMFNWEFELPVENVSWEDCQAFIDSLNVLTGKTFRLPSSLEWEFAARGGNLSHGYLYSGSDNPLLVAWHNGNSTTTQSLVKLLTPNELGLYDMSGNVDEWCNDQAAIQQHRVIRGGDFHWDAARCLVSWKGSLVEYRGSKLCGLRLAM